MHSEGVEPTRLAAPDPKSGASANSAMNAYGQGGIRTPGTLRFVGFQDRCNKPLYHLSFSAPGETRTHKPARAEVFETSVYTIPPQEQTDG